ncbi:MAG: hypothetical protein ACI85O_001380 [Saprospiraceae bacterium]|jgi:hypothetical protein
MIISNKALNSQISGNTVNRQRMKIRIKDNSIRLRLTQSEVDLLSEQGKVEKRTYFTPQNTLIYAIETADVSEMKATFENGKITVSLPTEKAHTWVNTEQVGMEYLAPISDSENLKILVEKDFTCLVKREGEDDLDAYPHPKEKN